MSIDKMGKLRLEPSVKEFMKDSVRPEGGENRRKSISCIKRSISKGKVGSEVHLKTGSILKNFPKPFEKFGADPRWQ